MQAEVEAYIREHDLWPYVEFFVAEPVGFGDLRDKTAQWWNLAAIEAEYEAFVQTYGPESERWLGSVREDPDVLREAFRLYVPMVTQWRRLPFLDPGLPPELLPAEWRGIAARRVFSELHRVLKPLSARYVDSLSQACV
nr:PaaX family transcriptional regulator C-terminal domain-containing protein [Kerstersia gyiorum]